MPYVVATSSAADAALGNTSTPLPVPIPTHASGDLFVAFLNSRATRTWATPAGWTAAGVQGNCAVFYRVATGAGETVSFDFGAGANFDVAALMYLIRGHHADVIDAATTGTNVNSGSMGNAAHTTTVNNSLVIHCQLADKDYNARYYLNGAILGESVVNNTQVLTNSAYFTQQIAGLVPELAGSSAYLDGNAQDYMTVSIKDAGTGGVKGQQHPNTAAQCIHPLMGTGQAAGGDWTGSERDADPTSFGAATGTLGIIDGVAAESLTMTTGQSVGIYDYELYPSFLSMNQASTSTYNRPIFERFSLDLTNHPMASGGAIDLSNSIFSVSAAPVTSKPLTDLSVGGMYVALGTGGTEATDETASKVWKLFAKDTKVTPQYGVCRAQFGINRTELTTIFNTPDFTDVTKIMLGWWFQTSGRMTFGMLYQLKTMEMVAGSSTFPCAMSDAVIAARCGGLDTISAQAGQAAAQFYCSQSISIGNGTQPVYWDSALQAIEFPGAFDEDGLFVHSNVDAGAYTLTVYGASGDTIKLRNTTINMGDSHNFLIHASTSATATYDFSGTFISNAAVVLNDIGSAISGLTFSTCGEITKNSADLSGGCTIDACVDAQAFTITSEADFNDLQNCIFTNQSALSIKITGNQTGSWSGVGMTVSGGLGSYDIEYTGTSDFTINMDTGSGWSDGRRNNSSSGTLTIAAPTTDVTINSDIAGSDIKLFDGASTQTATSSTTGTTLAYTYSGTKTWYYTVQKAGYVPQRGSITGTSETLTVNVTMTLDPIYTASHGLTYTTDYAYNATTRVLTLVAAEEGRNVYSSLIEEFISRAALYNRRFPMAAIGPDRIDFTTDGTTPATIDSGDIAFWRGAGMEWDHGTATGKTHKFCSIKGVGTNAAGTKGYYQYAAGSGTTAMTLVSNNLDQVIQYYSDTNGDGSADYDRSAHLVIKLFNEGYYQKRQDVLTAFGISALESFEYTLDLQMSAFDFASGTQSITIATLTDDSAAPQDHASSGNAFSYELVDPGANTAAALAAQINYDIFTDPTATLYTSYTAFNLPDIIIGAGGVYETQEGWVEDEDATLGFYVSRSAADHPDFLRFEDDGGTYYTPAVTSSVSVTGLTTGGADIRIQVSNVTAKTASDWAASTAYAVGDLALRTSGIGTESTAGLYLRCTTAGTSNDTEPTWDTTVGNTTADTAGTGAGDVVWTTYAILFADTDPAATSFSDTYIDGAEFKAGEAYEVRFAEQNAGTYSKRYQTTGIVGATGFTVPAVPVADDVYATNGVDGSGITKFSADTSASEINLVVAANFAASEAYAFFAYQLTLTGGMYSFWGGVTAADAGNYKIVTATLDLKFDNETTATQRQTDSARIYRDDDAYPVKDPTTSGYGIDINWKNVVYVVSTGGSALTAPEKIELTAAAGQSTTAATQATTAATQSTAAATDAAIAATQSTAAATDASTAATQSTSASTQATIARKMLQNRQHTDDETGKQLIYDDADTAVEFEAALYDDDEATTAWDGTNAINRRNRLIAP